MTETTDKPKLGARAPLGVKRTIETGKVKQSFSHGRSNTVVVEVKKRRILGRPGEVAAEAPAPAPVAAPAPPPPPAPVPAEPKPPRPMDAATRREMLQKQLLEAEEARLSALEEARRREDRQAQAATEDEKRRAEENRRAEEEAKQRSEQEIQEAAEAEARRAAAPPEPTVPVAGDEEDRRGGAARPRHGVPAKRP